MDDAGIPVPEAIERLQLEIERLTRELHSTLENSIYVRLSASEHKEYEEKCEARKRLIEEVALLVELRQHSPEGQSAVVRAEAPPTEMSMLNPQKPPKDEA